MSLRPRRGRALCLCVSITDVWARTLRSMRDRCVMRRRRACMASPSSREAFAEEPHRGLDVRRRQVRRNRARGPAAAAASGNTARSRKARDRASRACSMSRSQSAWLTRVSHAVRCMPAFESTTSTIAGACRASPFNIAVRRARSVSRRAAQVPLEPAVAHEARERGLLERVAAAILEPFRRDERIAQRRAAAPCSRDAAPETAPSRNCRCRSRDRRDRATSAPRAAVRRNGTRRRSRPRSATRAAPRPIRAIRRDAPSGSSAPVGNWCDGVTTASRASSGSAAGTSPSRIDATAAHVRAVRCEHLARAAIVRILEHDRLGRPEQHARRERERLLRAGHDQHVFRRRRHAATAREVVADLLAQRERDLAHRDSRTRRARPRDSIRAARRLRASDWPAAIRTAGCSAGPDAGAPESRVRRSWRARVARTRTAARRVSRCCAAAVADCRRSRRSCRSRRVRRGSLRPAAARTRRAPCCARCRARARANGSPASRAPAATAAVENRALQRADQLRVARPFAIQIEIHRIGSIIASDGGAPWYQ